jgi:hypothetical protein
MAACARCNGELDTQRSWCSDCEQGYDQWVRQHASDIIAPTLLATTIVAAFGMGLPLLGVGWLVASAGVFAGFGALYGTFRLLRRKRRKQFLETPLPRAYLPSGSGTN